MSESTITPESQPKTETLSELNSEQKSEPPILPKIFKKSTPEQLPEQTSPALPETIMCQEPFHRGLNLFNKFTAETNPFTKTVLTESNSKTMHITWLKLKNKQYKQLIEEHKQKNSDIFSNISLIEKLEKFESLLNEFGRPDSRKAKLVGRDISECLNFIKNFFKQLVQELDSEEILDIAQVNCSTEQYLNYLATKMDVLSEQLTRYEGFMKKFSELEYSPKQIGELKLMREEKLQASFLAKLKIYHTLEKEYDEYSKRHREEEKAREASRSISPTNSEAKSSDNELLADVLENEKIEIGELKTLNAKRPPNVELETAGKIKNALKVFMTFDSAGVDACFEQFGAIFKDKIKQKSHENNVETKSVKNEMENQSSLTDNGNVLKWIRTVYDEYIRSCQIARDRQHHSQLDKICLSAGIQDSRKVEYENLVKDSEKEPEKEKSLKAGIGSVEISDPLEESGDIDDLASQMDDEVSLHSSEDRSDDEMMGGLSDDDGDSVFSVGMGRAKKTDSTTDVKRKTTSDCRSDDKSDSKTVNKSENVTVNGTKTETKTDFKTDIKTDTQKTTLERSDTFHSCQETINLTLLSSDEETKPSPAKKIKLDEPIIDEVPSGLKIDSDSDEFDPDFQESVGNNSKNVKQAQHDEIICLDSD